MTELQGDTLITMDGMGSQVHAIGKAIGPFSQIWSHMLVHVLGLLIKADAS